MPVPTASSVVVRSEQPLSATVDGEIVMLDARQAVYFSLDAVASAIWQLIEEPVSVDALCESLVSRYHIDRQACLTDVTAFLAELIDAELVAVRHRSGD
jgi:hypothetical protein